MAACLMVDRDEQTIWIADAAIKAFFTANQLATFSSQ